MERGSSGAAIRRPTSQSTRTFGPEVSLRAPVRPTREGWPTGWFPARLRRFFYTSPAAVLDPDCAPEDYRRAMFAIYVGGTIKITWAGRQTESDQLLIDRVDLTGARIVDMGASDGSTSRDLIEALTARGARFASFAVTDRFLELGWTRTGSRIHFFDDDRCVLIAGRRLLVWPQLSSTVARWCAISVRRAARRPRRTVQLINPEVRALMAADPRLRCARHDIFTPWPEGPVEVVKTANVLRRVYFSDEEIRAGLKAVHASLVPGGHLLLSDNSRRAGGIPGGALYRRTPDGFERVAATGRAPDIDDLVTGLRLVSSRPAEGPAETQPVGGLG